MLLHGAFMLSGTLGIGYALLAAAKKQAGILKTVGYTLGIAVIIIALGAGVIDSNKHCLMMGKMMYDKCGMGKMGGMMKGLCPTMTK